MLSQDEKTKLEAARSLIKQKEYDLAAGILRTINNPTAQEWLAEIEAAQTRKVRQRRVEIMIALAALAVIGILGSVGLYVATMSANAAVVVVPTQAVLSSSTPTETATLLPTATFTPKVIVLIVTTTLTPTMTNTFTATATDTSTPTDTPTITLTPSMTITTTVTPRPTSTLASTSTPVTVQTVEPQLYSISTGKASLYACPRLDCQTVADLTNDDTVMVVGKIDGEALVGNSVWYSVFFGNRAGFINSSMVTLRPANTATPAPPTSAFPTVGVPAQSAPPSVPAPPHTGSG